MSRSPPAIQKADSASLRPHYETPMQLGFRGVPDAQGNKGPGRYVLFENDENLARYNALFDHNPNPPTSKVQAYERCGATFFYHLFECEDLREHHLAWGGPRDAPPMKSLVLDMSGRRIDTTQKNIEKAEAELEENVYGFHEKFIEEERKTLIWLKENLRPGFEQPTCSCGYGLEKELSETKRT